MHLIQIVRSYLGLTQQELAKRVGITQADLCDMEIKPPYGRIDKYQRLSNYLGIPVHALVSDDCTLVPLSFFDKYPHATYKKAPSRGTSALGRAGEEAALAYEQGRLEKVNPSLAKLVIPHCKIGNRPGYDMLSFEEDGTPIYIEVKTTADDSPDYVLTNQEYLKANKAIAKGEKYLIYRFTNWGTDSQRLTIIDFKNQKENGEIWPSVFTCSTIPKTPITTGIRFYREACGMSKSELADNLGIKTCHLWRYETGEYRCPVELYLRISKILGVTIDELAKTIVQC